MVVRIHWEFTINAFKNTWKIILVLHTRPLFRSTKVNYFIAQLWQLTVSNVGARTRSMTGQVGGFQNPRVCLQAFPSFLPHPLNALLAPFYAQSLTLVPRYLLLNRMETLATQATRWLLLEFAALLNQKVEEFESRLRLRFDLFVCFFFPLGLPQLLKLWNTYNSDGIFSIWRKCVFYKGQTRANIIHNSFFVCWACNLRPCMDLSWQ